MGIWGEGQIDLNSGPQNRMGGKERKGAEFELKPAVDSGAQPERQDIHVKA